MEKLAVCIVDLLVGGFSVIGDYVITALDVRADAICEDVSVDADGELGIL